MARSTKYKLCLLKRGARKPIECWHEEIWDPYHQSPEDVAIRFADGAHRAGRKVFGKTLTVSYSGITERFAIESYGGLASVRRMR
jgi:hypothetical protein